ncbi:MAG: hypothetical protein QXR53_02150 [Candidatus Norongarragalinales archaeon]
MKILFVAFVLASVLFSGCAQQQAQPTPTETPENAAPSVQAAEEAAEQPTPGMDEIDPELQKALEELDGISGIG